MNLLNMLMGSMTSSSSVEALSGKTGTSSSLTSTLISAALPMLLQALTSNASSQGGVQSLLGALTQHTSTSTMAEQLQNADADDGSAIIQHIFGQNTGSAIQSLSSQTGANEAQVSSILNNMAPAMMSGLSAAAASANTSSANDGFDFSDLMGMFGGNAAAQSNTDPNVVPFNTSADTSGSSGLFGASGSSDSFNASGGLGSLFSGIGGLGGLFGGSDSADADTSAFDGSSLLGSLTSLMK